MADKLLSHRDTAPNMLPIRDREKNTKTGAKLTNSRPVIQDQKSVCLFAYSSSFGSGRSQATVGNIVALEGGSKVIKLFKVHHLLDLLVS